jgi:hypothetical protein
MLATALGSALGYAKSATAYSDIEAEACFIGLVLVLAASGLSVNRILPQRWLAWYNRFSARKYVPILAIMAAAGVIRLALLPWYPIPLPRGHDEFSLLLGAKTFAMGRLTNPTHPMWVSFETFHVLQQPTYVSIYPPAQAAMLALGIAIGNPWFAVLGCWMLTCGAFVWMLRPWFPPGWALCGGILLLSRTLMSYWSDTAWGGTLAALSAAVIVGAAGRIWFQRNAPWRYGWLLGAGIAVLLNRRPFEGLFLIAGIGLMLTYRLFKKADRPILRQAIRVAGPVLAVLLPCAAFIGYYNARATGDPLVMPYVKGIQTYAIARHDIFIPAAPEPAYRNPQFRAFYRREYDYYLYRQRHFLRSLAVPAFNAWRLYLGLSLSLPLLMVLPWIWRSRRIRPILLILTGCLAVNATETFILPHYLAPELPLVWIVVIESMIVVWTKWRNWGRSIVAASIVSCALGLPSLFLSNAIRNIHHDLSWPRSRIAATLAATPGKHLIFVKYLPGHSIVYDEWVYNEPDIDSSRIVWARDLGPEQNARCIDYFHGRRIWEADVGQAEAVVSFREITPATATVLPAPAQ